MDSLTTTVGTKADLSYVNTTLNAYAKTVTLNNYVKTSAISGLVAGNLGVNVVTENYHRPVDVVSTLKVKGFDVATKNYVDAQVGLLTTSIGLKSDQTALNSLTTTVGTKADLSYVNTTLNAYAKTVTLNNYVKTSAISGLVAGNLGVNVVTENYHRPVDVLSTLKVKGFDVATRNYVDAQVGLLTTSI